MIEFDLDVIRPVIEDTQTNLVLRTVLTTLALADPDTEWSVEVGFAQDGEKIHVKLMSVA